VAFYSVGCDAMEIIYASNRESSRQFVLDHLRCAKAANRAWKVIDIGGAYCPWSAHLCEVSVAPFEMTHRCALKASTWSPNDERPYRAPEKALSCDPIPTGNVHAPLR
jgi:hypothetical protein